MTQLHTCCTEILFVVTFPTQESPSPVTLYPSAPPPSALSIFDMFFKSMNGRGEYDFPGLDHAHSFSCTVHSFWALAKSRKKIRCEVKHNDLSRLHLEGTEIAGKRMDLCLMAGCHPHTDLRWGRAPFFHWSNK